MDTIAICARPGCETPLTPVQRYNRRRYCCLICSRRRRDHLFAAPPEPRAPLPPVFADGWIGGPSPDAAAVELGREGRTVYTEGLLNGCAVVYDGPGRVYCAAGAWPASTAYHRLQDGPREASSGALARVSTAGGLRGESM